jgi:hypothetical protein
MKKPSGTQKDTTSSRSVKPQYVSKESIFLVDPTGYVTVSKSNLASA